VTRDCAQALTRRCRCFPRRVSPQHSPSNQPGRRPEPLRRALDTQRPMRRMTRPHLGHQVCDDLPSEVLNAASTRIRPTVDPTLPAASNRTASKRSCWTCHCASSSVSSTASAVKERCTRHGKARDSWASIWASNTRSGRSSSRLGLGLRIVGCRGCRHRGCCLVLLLRGRRCRMSEPLARPARSRALARPRTRLRSSFPLSARRGRRGRCLASAPPSPALLRGRLCGTVSHAATAATADAAADATAATTPARARRSLTFFVLLVLVLVERFAAPGSSRRAARAGAQPGEVAGADQLAQ
jgi:hypothetical protein